MTKRLLLAALWVWAAFGIVASTVELKPVGSWPGYPSVYFTRIVVHQGFAYAFSEIVHVFDVSNPQRPVRVGTMPAKYSDIALCGDFLIGADPNRGLDIYSLAQPGNPQLVRTIEGSNVLPTWSRGAVWVRCFGRFVFGGFGEGRSVEGYDLANPAAPVRIFAEQFVTKPVAIGSWLYYWPFSAVVTSPKMFNPETRQSTNSVMDHGRTIDSAVSGKYAYVTSYAPGGVALFVLDVSDPLRATGVGSSIILEGSNERSVKVRGDLLFVGGPGPAVYSIANPTKPTLLGNLPWYWIDVETAGAIGYVAAAGRGLEIVSLENASFPRVGKFDEVLGGMIGFDLEGNYCYVGEGDAMRILDISNPGAISARGRYFPGSGIVDVDAVGNRAVLAFAGTFDFGPLELVDVTDPDRPTVWARLPSPLPQGYNISAIAANSSTIFTTPLAAVNMDGGGLIDAPLNGTSLFLHKNFLIGVHEGRLALFDARRPGALQPLSKLADISAQKAAAVGDLVFAANDTTLYVVDISKPERMRQVGTYSTSRRINEMAAAGNFLFTVDDAQLSVIDIADPAAPTLKMSVPVWNRFFGGVATKGKHVFVSDLNVGIRALEFVAPARVMVRRPLAEENVAGDRFGIEWAADGSHAAGDWRVTFEAEGRPAVVINGAAIETGNGMWKSEWMPPAEHGAGCGYRVRVRDMVNNVESLSATFCMLPEVRVEFNAGATKLSWENRFSDYSLYRAFDVKGPWEAVTDGIVDAPNLRTYEAQSQSGPVFFKLQK